jgi:hypothetical protein
MQFVQRNSPLTKGEAPEARGLSGRSAAILARLTTIIVVLPSLHPTEVYLSKGGRRFVERGTARSVPTPLTIAKRTSPLLTYFGNLVGLA